MLGTKDLVAFVGTTDLPRARAFYGGALGLSVVEEGPFACVFDAHGTSLRVTPVDEVAPAPYTVLGWTVPDVASTVAALAAVGVAVERFDGVEQDGLGVWQAPGGARVAWFRDPDGNLLSVTEPPVSAGAS